MEKHVPIRAISRSIAVLQAVNRAGSLSMMDIAHASSVPYPTACRIVQTLLHEGLIEREPARKRYRPTALVQTLSHGFQDDGRLATAARRHIVAMTKEFGWPISITTHVGHRMVVRDSTHAITSLTFNNYYPGYTLPILECASGQAFLAFCSPEERKSILDTLRAIPENSANNTLDLFESNILVEEIRRVGYAAKGRNKYNNNPGKTSSIAVPVLQNGEPIGALSLIYFASAMRPSDAVDKYLAPLQKVAQTVAEEMNERFEVQAA